MAFGYFFVLRINQEKITVRGDGYVSRDRANRAFAIALNDCGYRAPRFWQFWRWGEQKPSRDVLSLMRRERGSL
ncbi:hypothetical protein [Ensifer sp. OV372]|uniref:hypothetical protein n=1 Tax=Ensifer sp. OV372 TaxID=1855293 RepID=UPI0008E7F36B|nr:hypothetical protein [Ensifer sp. OV372]SFG87703.1 hypothetical protein SAMN05216459_11120 [Ensifer sp. OV372]